MADTEGFQVRDRRGRPKDEVTPEPAPPGEASRPAGARLSGAEAPASPPRAGGLEGLFAMFAASALIGLGAVPDPITGESGVDLGQAREAVDALLLLRDKTEGNRTPEESRVLEEILYDLQLRFVRTSAPQRRG